MRRLCEIHAKVCSAIYLLGSLLVSILRPSLNHSLAQILKTFSGGGFGERFTNSTSTPNSLTAHSLPRPRQQAATHRRERRVRRCRASSTSRCITPDLQQRPCAVR